MALCVLSTRANTDDLLRPGFSDITGDVGQCSFLLCDHGHIFLHCEAEDGHCFAVQAQQQLSCCLVRLLRLQDANCGLFFIGQCSTVHIGCGRWLLAQKYQALVVDLVNRLIVVWHVHLGCHHCFTWRSCRWSCSPYCRVACEQTRLRWTSVSSTLFMHCQFKSKTIQTRLSQDCSNSTLSSRTHMQQKMTSMMNCRWHSIYHSETKIL